ncbi:MAG TPA: aminotransferase class V-fold PLP-dependent enzyme [Vicinamibacterales bacterium]|nr:aminotransferase class V-fold PLP-dependent enzyme [Vicinamibacterales bacterium]
MPPARYRAGRHFLQIPGPTNVPERVLRAMARPTIDHRGPEFGPMVLRILARLKQVCRTSNPVLFFPSSGTGAWEAALVNTLARGDRVLAVETGYFATLWRNVARKLGFDVHWIESDWRHAADPTAIQAALEADTAHAIKAVLVVHNETSTGITSRIDLVRDAMNAAGHPALLMVDTVSSLGSVPYEHDAWCVDVMVSGSQKGLMLPPGIGINAVSERALAASKTSTFRKAYWDWAPMLVSNETGYTPYTPPTNLLFGLDESLDMLLAEGLHAVFERHRRFGEATRRAVSAWGLELCPRDSGASSNTLTAVWLPDGHDADALRTVILDRFDMSLGAGLGRVKRRVVRIGHLGDLNDLTLVGAIAGFEMGLGLAGVPHTTGGVAAAMDWLAAR